jgi:hypothetical protein
MMFKDPNISQNPLYNSADPDLQKYLSQVPDPSQVSDPAKSPDLSRVGCPANSGKSGTAQCPEFTSTPVGELPVHRPKKAILSDPDLPHPIRKAIGQPKASISVHNSPT